MERIFRSNQGLSSINQVVEALRQQIAGKEKVDSRDGNTRISKKRQTEKLSIEQLEQSIINRIKQIPADAVARDEQISQVFIGSILAWEFGDAFLQDAMFVDIMSDVMDMIASNDSLKKTFRDFIQSLS
ncbi:MAG: hypothetical protein OEZ58_07730 [Gammaproteobacteria bacterium]|nr:hypothetical protein [Gammaproteobacteria bacterium]MDH5728865.1 hypothetical protein [Gammaproteobacteria bacterium]